MLGTLNGALEARGINLEPHALTAAVEGTLEMQDGIATLTRIDVHYTISAQAEQRETIDRALARHADKCPTAHAFKGKIDVAWTARITDEGPGGAVGG